MSDKEKCPKHPEGTMRRNHVGMPGMVPATLSCEECRKEEEAKRRSQIVPRATDFAV